MSYSPDTGTGSLGKLRLSSATQEKLQYPLGISAAVLPADDPTAKTTNPHHTLEHVSQRRKVRKQLLKR